MKKKSSVEWHDTINTTVFLYVEFHVDFKAVAQSAALF